MKARRVARRATGGRSEQDEEGRGKQLPWTRIVRGRTPTPPTGRRSGRQKERVTHDVDTVAAMVSQQRKEEGRGGRGGIADRCYRRRRTKRRRKANKGAQAATKKTTATVEEDEAKTIAAINVGCMNNGADDLMTVLRCLRTARRWLGATLMQGASEAMCDGRHYIVVLLIYQTQTLLYLIIYYKPVHHRSPPPRSIMRSVVRTMMIASMWTHRPPLRPNRPLPKYVGNVCD